MPEIPLVVDDSSESITKTSKAVQILKAVGAYEDAEKAKDSKNVRRGKGKMRNRRYVNRKGPLVIYGNDNGIAKAFRNLPGVDTAPVTALNLMQVGCNAVIPLLHQPHSTVNTLHLIVALHTSDSSVIQRSLLQLVLHIYLCSDTHQCQCHF